MSVLKIVIADANGKFCEMLEGYVRFRKDMEVVGASGDCGEVMQLIEKEKPNAIVMDLMLETSDMLLSYIQPWILAFSRVQNHLIIPLSYDWNNRSFSGIDPQLDMVSEWIKELLKPTPAEAQDRALELRISELLRQLGVPAHIKGYQYLRKAIITVTKDPEVISGVTKILYPDIAKAYGTTPGGVERAMRKAIEVAWDRGDIDCLQHYFGNAVNPEKGKPTNSEFIATVADIMYLQQDCTKLAACV